MVIMFSIEPNYTAYPLVTQGKVQIPYHKRGVDFLTSLKMYHVN
ncbi:hypothetical protein SAMN02745910_03213 [Priestia endophytica DSM 13796]|uniref:Uncharacterized protein n=1 Tax=Priestia endophytica DSM 13796 TaxID=1121089 RepID=A0A1I6B341_9BACI|nr:hypothetical protein SAMN02745910_03213 [Priestia endophytica DSM 13796]